MSRLSRCSAPRASLLWSSWSVGSRLRRSRSTSSIKQQNSPEADAALLTDAELAALVAMAGAADDADVCLQHGCDMDEAILAEKEAAEVAPELY